MAQIAGAHKKTTWGACLSTYAKQVAASRRRRAIGVESLIWVVPLRGEREKKKNAVQSV